MGFRCRRWRLGRRCALDGLAGELTPRQIMKGQKRVAELLEKYGSGG